MNKKYTNFDNEDTVTKYFKEVKMSRGDVNSLKHENVRDMNYFNKYDKNTIFKDAQLSDLVNQIIH